MPPAGETQDAQRKTRMWACRSVVIHRPKCISLFLYFKWWWGSFSIKLFLVNTKQMADMQEMPLIKMENLGTSSPEGIFVQLILFNLSPYNIHFMLSKAFNVIAGFD
jgi:hypothetical protein